MESEFDVSRFLPASRRDFVRPSRLIQTGRYPFRHTTLYGHINAGILVTPIQLGPGVTAFIGEEIDSILAARVAGATDSDIKRLVKLLVTSRAHAHEPIKDVRAPERLSTNEVVCSP